MQHGIISESFEELIKKMNEFEKSNQVFASQVYPVNTDKLRWYGIIFYKSTKVVPTPLSASNSPLPAKKSSNILSKPITEGQKKFLEINRESLIEQGFKVDVKSSKEAWKVISEFKKKNNLNGSEI